MRVCLLAAAPDVDDMHELDTRYGHFDARTLSHIQGYLITQMNACILSRIIIYFRTCLLYIYRDTMWTQACPAEITLGLFVTTAGFHFSFIVMEEGGCKVKCKSSSRYYHLWFFRQL